MVALAWFLVGVTVIEVVAFETLVEQVVDEPVHVPVNVPVDIANAERVASVEGVE